MGEGGVVKVGGDHGELRPWHYTYEGRGGQWGTPTMALHIRIQRGVDPLDVELGHGARDGVVDVPRQVALLAELLHPLPPSSNCVPALQEDA